MKIPTPSFSDVILLGGMALILIVLVAVTAGPRKTEPNQPSNTQEFKHAPVQRGGAQEY